MSAEPADMPLHAPLEDLERGFIEEYIRSHGHDPGALEFLSEADRDALLRDASVYASSRLAEVEARSHLLDEMHDRSR